MKQLSYFESGWSIYNVFTKLFNYNYVTVIELL